MTAPQPLRPQPVSLPVAILATLLALDLMLLALLWTGGPSGWSLGPVRLLPGYVESAVPLALVLGLLCWGARVGRPRLAELTRTQLLTRWRGAGPVRRLALMASVILGLGAVDEALQAPKAALRIRLTQAAQPQPSLTYNRDNRHVPELLAALLQQSPRGDAVVLVDDDDARAHEAAYYAYPLLLYMAPEQRAWSLRARMDHLGAPDPTLAPTAPAPAMHLSEAFADERGMRLLHVSRGDVISLGATRP